MPTGTDSGNAKGELIAACRTLGLADPSFECESGGPGHAPWFRCTVRQGERDLGRGEGRSRRDAERAASQAALKTLLPGSVPGESRSARSPAPGRWPIYADLLREALLVAHERRHTGTPAEVAQDAATLYRQLLTELGHLPEKP